MKIIFLDIDGVLITIKRQKLDGLGIMGLNHIDNSIQMLDDESVLNLKNILQDPSIFIVISSSWRHAWEGCKELLQSIPLIRDDETEYHNNYGYSVWDRVISKTGEATEGGRSTEILMWLNEYHRTAKYGYHITHWVAIDDEYYDMKAIRRIGKLIKTEPSIGITVEHANEIISLLNQ